MAWADLVDKQKYFDRDYKSGREDLMGIVNKSRGSADALRNRLGQLDVPSEKLQKESMPGFTGPSAPMQQFDVARNRAKQGAQTAAQQGTEAMNRRFAAMGSLNSGAAIKAVQNVQDSANQQEQNAMNQIGAQEEQVRFDVDQANLNRDLQRQESSAQRNFQRELKNQDQAFQDKVFSFDSGSKLAQMDIAISNAALEADAQEFNKNMEMFKQRTSGGLFGAGGFAGLGFSF